MLYTLLTSISSSDSSMQTGGCFSKENLPQTLTMLAIFTVLIVGYYFLNKRSMKKRQEYIDRRNNIQPGNKVMTIGGITGTVVEVNPDDNTFVLETGSEEFGKSYLRFDKAAIHQTDVEIEPAQTQPETPVEEISAEAETEADELFNEVVDETTNETVDETTDEE